MVGKEKAAMSGGLGARLVASTRPAVTNALRDAHRHMLVCPLPARVEAVAEDDGRCRHTLDPSYPQVQCISHTRVRILVH